MVSIRVVDDEMQFLELTRMFLEKGRGITVYTATSGDMALEMLKERRYDAIISDYAMPGMNGIEFMKRVRVMGDDTPFAIFTGTGEGRTW
jgi:CheY-like chemotaxis protein